MRFKTSGFRDISNFLTNPRGKWRWVFSSWRTKMEGGWPSNISELTKIGLRDLSNNWGYEPPTVNPRKFSNNNRNQHKQHKQHRQHRQHKQHNKHNQQDDDDKNKNKNKNKNKSNNNSNNHNHNHSHNHNRNNKGSNNNRCWIKKHIRKINMCSGCNYNDKHREMFTNTGDTRYG